MKVRNLVSERSGESVRNQFIILDKGCRYFQSYDSMIVKIDKNENVFLDKKYWNYSRTTSKYRNQFLNCTTEEVKERIKSGKYKLVNLN